jgi:uncharacterized surface protein with fasciclin (FAS1) repeats
MLHRLALLSLVLLASCTQEPQSKSSATSTPATPAKKEAAPAPPADPNNIVSIAASSKDHTTLVAALQAADYVKSIGNPGPLTVFAPTNAAFEKLPPGTVETLLKPEKQADLKEILKYHATTSVWDLSTLKDGMQLAMANGKKVTIKVEGDKVKVNDANIVASVRASNGMLHIIDAVLLPPAQ